MTADRYGRMPGDPDRETARTMREIEEEGARLRGEIVGHVDYGRLAEYDATRTGAEIDPAWVAMRIAYPYRGPEDRGGER